MNRLSLEKNLQNTKNTKNFLYFVTFSHKILLNVQCVLIILLTVVEIPVPVLSLLYLHDRTIDSCNAGYRPPRNPPDQFLPVLELP